ALRTLATLLLVSLYVLLVGPPALLWTMASRDVRLLYAAGDAGVRLGFAVAGIRVRVVGASHVQRERPAVYAANHSSNIDPPAVSGGRLAMRKGSPLIWPATVTVELSDPIPTSGMAADDRDVLMAQVRAAIAARLPKTPATGN